MTVRFTCETVDREDGRTSKVTRKCELCGQNISVFVRPEDFADFAAGRGYLQELFPYLDAGERELLRAGFCDPCFNRICPPDDGD